MADTVQTLRPNATNSNTNFTVVGAANIETALSDDSDASYANMTGGFPGLHMGFGTFTIPALAIVNSVTLRTRFYASTIGTGGLSCTTDIWVASSYYSASATLVSIPHDYIVGPSTASSNILGNTSPYGVAWTQTDIDNIVAELGETGGVTFRVYEMYIDVGYNQAPVVSAVTVPNVASTKPSITFTYTDPESDSMERLKVRIFSAAQYGIGGFDPETSPNTYDSGEKFATVASTFNYTFTGVTTSLTNGTTYKAYVKAADAGSSGRYGTWVASSAFTIAVNAPAAPVMTAAVDYINQRLTLTVTPTNPNLLTDNQASLELNTVAGWGSPVNISTGVLTTSAGSAKDGSYSLYLNSAAAGNMSATTSIGQNGVPVLPNTAYEALASFAYAVSGRNVNVGIKWWKSDGTASSTPLSTGADIAEVGPAVTTYTQAVLSVTSPADAAYASVIVTVKAAGGALEVHYCDKISLAPGSSTTWQPGGPYSAVIQRSDDGGVTWANLKRPNPVAPPTADSNGVISIPAASSVVTAYDYEATRGTGPLYRAYVYVVDPTNGELDSPYSASVSSDLSLVSTSLWNIKVPSNPSLNMLNVTLEFQEPFLDITRHETGGFMTVIGRTKKIKISDAILGDEFPITVNCTTAAQYNAIMGVVNSQTTVLLQAPTGQQWYVGIDLDVNRRVSQIPTLYYRSVAFNCIELDTP